MRNLLRIIFFSIVIVLLAGGCSSAETVTPVLPITETAQTATDVSTLTPTQTKSPKPTLTVSPSHTLTKTATRTPTVTMIPTPTQLVISRQNLNGLGLIYQWDAGTPAMHSKIKWAPKSDWFVLTEGDGVHRYDVQKLRNNLIIYKEYAYAINPNGAEMAIQAPVDRMIDNNRYITIGVMFVETNHYSKINQISDNDCFVDFHIAYSPNGKLIATGAEVEGARNAPYKSNVAIWDLDAKQCKTVIERAKGIVTSLEFSSDNRYLLASFGGDITYLIDLDTGKEVCGLVGHLAAFSPVENIFALYGYQDKAMSLWHAETCEIIRLIGEVAPSGDEFFRPYSMDFSPDGSLLAVGGEYNASYIKIWDVETGELLFTSEELPSFVSDLAFSPDGRYLAFDLWIDASNENEYYVNLWGVQP